MTHNHKTQKKVPGTSKYRRRAAFSAVLTLALFGVVLTTSTVGAQTILCDGKPATIIGTPESETLTGTPGDDVIVGLQGDDRIFGAGGNDTICGGKGDDVLRGGQGFDVIFGAQGDDEIYAQFGGDITGRQDELGARMFGGAGDDIIHGSNRWDRMQGGLGNDILRGYEGRDWIRGGGDRDDVSGGLGIDDLHGGNGSDRIAITANDLVRGGNGIDMCVLSGNPEMLRSCGRNRPESTPNDGKARYSAGGYLTPREVPAGMYRTNTYWQTDDVDDRTVSNDFQSNDGPTVAFVDERAATVTFRTTAQRIDGATPALNPFAHTNGRFVVGLDIAPGTYRVRAIDQYRPNITTYDMRGRIIDIEATEGSAILTVTPEAAFVDFRGKLERVATD